MFLSTVTPYYDHAGITIYCGDCRDVLPGVEGDALITDPPWTASDSRFEVRGAGRAAPSRPSYSLRYGDIGMCEPDVIATAMSRVAGDCLILVGYRELASIANLCVPLRGIFVWHKANAALPQRYPAKLDTSFIVWGGRKSSLYGRQVWPSTVFSFPLPTAGCVSTRERVTIGWNGPAAHPAQGPLALYKTLIAPLAGQVILDPFMGSGTTLRAAKDLGCRAIGIEIEERYCEIAAKRLAQDVLFAA
jgi:site-specific DNA-methyltransferase (adenine-specific)